MIRSCINVTRGVRRCVLTKRRSLFTLTTRVNPLQKSCGQLRCKTWACIKKQNLITEVKTIIFQSIKMYNSNTYTYTQFCITIKKKKPSSVFSYSIMLQRLISHRSAEKYREDNVCIFLPHNHLIDVMNHCHEHGSHTILFSPMIPLSLSLSVTSSSDTYIITQSVDVCVCVWERAC